MATLDPEMRGQVHDLECTSPIGDMLERGMSEQNLQNHKTNRTLRNLSVAFDIVVRHSLFEPKEGFGQPCIPAVTGSRTV